MPIRRGERCCVFRVGPRPQRRRLPELSARISKTVVSRRHVGLEPRRCCAVGPFLLRGIGPGRATVRRPGTPARRGASKEREGSNASTCLEPGEENTSYEHDHDQGRHARNTPSIASIYSGDSYPEGPSGGGWLEYARS